MLYSLVLSVVLNTNIHSYVIDYDLTREDCNTMVSADSDLQCIVQTPMIRSL